MAKVEKGKGGKAPDRKGGGKKEAPAPAPAAEESASESKFVPRLRDVYRDRVVPSLMKEFGFQNPMQVPRLERIVLNVGMGEAIQNVKLLESAFPRPAMKSRRRRPASDRASRAPVWLQPERSSGPILRRVPLPRHSQTPRRRAHGSPRSRGCPW